MSSQRRAAEGGAQFEAWMLRKKQSAHPPPHINGERVEGVLSFKFPGTHTSGDLLWMINAAVPVKKGTEMAALHEKTIRKMKLWQQVLVSLYHRSVKSVLTHTHSAGDKQVPSESHNVTQKTHHILKDEFYPLHRLFGRLPSRKPATDP